MQSCLTFKNGAGADLIPNTKGNEIISQRVGQGTEYEKKRDMSR